MDGVLNEWSVKVVAFIYGDNGPVNVRNHVNDDILCLCEGCLKFDEAVYFKSDNIGQDNWSLVGLKRISKKHQVVNYFVHCCAHI